MIFLVDKNDHNCMKGRVELRKTPVNYYWEEVEHACERIEWKMEGERERKYQASDIITLQKDRSHLGIGRERTLIFFVAP